MNEQSEHGEEEASSGANGDVLFLLKQLKEQLTFLERKVDTLLNQTKQQPKPAYDQERSYSKPAYRPSYNSERPRESRYEGKRPEGRYEGAGPSKYAGKPSGSGRGYGPSKPYAPSSSAFAGKKKPFFAKRKERD